MRLALSRGQLRQRLVLAAIALTAVAALAYGPLNLLGAKGPLDGALTAEQQVQFDQALAASLPPTTGDPAETKRWSKRFSAICSTLDQSAPVLRSLATTCPVHAQTTQLLVLVPVRCSEDGGVGQCVRVLKRLSRQFELEGMTGPAFDETVRSAIDDEQCVGALVTEGGYEPFKQAAEFTRRGAEALEQGSLEVFKVAMDQLASIDVGEDDGRPATAMLDDFREHCQPA